MKFSAKLNSKFTGAVIFGAVLTVLGIFGILEISGPGLPLDVFLLIFAFCAILTVLIAGRRPANPTRRDLMFVTAWPLLAFGIAICLSRMLK